MLGCQVSHLDVKAYSGLVAHPHVDLGSLGKTHLLADMHYKR